jgi:hypothetical protein
MGLQLPGELISLLGMLGYTWPEADEEKLFKMGDTWMSFGGALQGSVSEANGITQSVWASNQGEAIEAFRQEWSDDEAPSASLSDASTTCMIIGIGMFVAAIIVLVLKINVIVQLVMLAIEIAQAIATAGPTFGASLAEIPIFKEIAGLIIDQIINMAIEALLNG